MIIRAPDDKKVTVKLHPLDKRKCRRIAFGVIIQCIAVFVGSCTVTYCMWSPQNVEGDFQILARVMYLYDYKSCKTNLRSQRVIKNLLLSNDTENVEGITAINCTLAIASAYSLFPQRFRQHVHISVGFHVIWFISAIALVFFSKMEIIDFKILRHTLNLFFYVTIFMTIYDLLLALLYIPDIQQALTKGMVLRHSGWSVVIKLKSYDDFAGWLPMAASVCWMRGIVFLATNILSIKAINSIKGRVKKREVHIKMAHGMNDPFPEAGVLKSETRKNALLIRAP